MAVITHPPPFLFESLTPILKDYVYVHGRRSIKAKACYKPLSTRSLFLWAVLITVLGFIALVEVACHQYSSNASDVGTSGATATPEVSAAMPEIRNIDLTYSQGHPPSSSYCMGNPPPCPTPLGGSSMLISSSTTTASSNTHIEITTSLGGENGQMPRVQSTLSATATLSPPRQSLTVTSATFTPVKITPRSPVTDPSRITNEVIFYSYITERQVQVSTTIPVAVVTSRPYVSSSTISIRSAEKPISTGLVIQDNSTLVNRGVAATHMRRTTSQNISNLEYFIGYYVPTLAAVVFRILWAVVYNDARLMEPFYRLASSSGAQGRDSLGTLLVFTFQRTSMIRNPILMTPSAISRLALCCLNLFVP
jgi:hypothetical protein